MWEYQFKFFVKQCSFKLIKNARGIQVFDISDTHETLDAKKDVKLFKFDKDKDELAFEELEKAYDVLEIGAITIEDRVFNLIWEQSEELLGDILYEVGDGKEGSIIDGLEEIETRRIVKDILTKSASYSIMVRMGLDPEKHFEENDFSNIIYFNNTHLISAIGTYSSLMTRNLIADLTVEIERKEKENYRQDNVHNLLQNTIESRYNMINQESELKTEDRRAIDSDIRGGNSNERDSELSRNGLLEGRENLHANNKDNILRRDGRELSSRGRSIDTELESEKNEVREIWKNEREVSKREQTSLLQQPENRRETGESLGDDSGTISKTNRDGDAEASKLSGSNRRVESIGSNEMDRNDEQHKINNRRDNYEGDNIQLEDEESKSKLFPTEKQQQNIIKNAVDKESTAFLLPQKDIDEILVSGSNKKDSILKIIAFYKKDKPLEEKINFLKNEYQEGGKGFIIDGNKIATWFNQDGINIGLGHRVDGNKNVMVLTWEETSKRIDSLLESGRYASEGLLDIVDEFERKEMAESLWYLYRDYLGGLPVEWEKGGFPEEVSIIQNELEDSDNVSNVLSKLTLDLSESEIELPSNHKNILNRLEDLLRAQKEYKSEIITNNDITMYITEDEIDSLLIDGSNVSGGKERIYNFFKENTSQKERENFLKSEYGIGGSSHALMGADNSYEDHSAKGIEIKRGDIFDPYDKIFLSWKEVATGIDNLIASQKYYSREKMQELDFKREELKEDIRNKMDTETDHLSINYKLGEEVFIGTKAYILIGFEDDNVELRDVELPQFIFNNDMR